MTGDVGKKHGRIVYLCQGCRRPLSATLVRQGRDTHDGCAADAVRRFEVAQARREGIPVKLWRERRGEAPQEPVAHQAPRSVTTAMRMARIYMRVSTEQQDIERQEEIVRSARASGYREKASGARADRPELLRMIADRV